MTKAAEIAQTLCCGQSGCLCLKAAECGFGLTHCPVSSHPDVHPSLSVNEVNGLVLFNCKAYCSQQQVQDALAAKNLWGHSSNGLSAITTVVPQSTQAVATIPKVKTTLADKQQYFTAAYKVCDPQGNHLATKNRYDPPYPQKKYYEWLQADGTKGLGDDLKTENLLYGIESLRYLPKGSTVYFVEGEKVAAALIAVGLNAVGTTSGAKGTPSKEILSYLDGFILHLCPDNDPEGRNHMDRTYTQLQELGHPETYKLDWGEAPEHGDLADAIEYFFMDATDIETLASFSKPYELTVAPEPEKILELAPAEKVSLVDYSNWITKDIPIKNGHTLTIRATDIHKDLRGVYGKVEVLLDGKSVVSDRLNLDLLRSRDNLIRGCYLSLQHALGEVLDLYLDVPTLGAYIHAFCLGLWDQTLTGLESVPVLGDPELPINMALGDYIIKGGGSIMYGPPGAGKSYIALAMALSIASRNTKLWNVPENLKPVYLNLERHPDSIIRRVGQIKSALDLCPDQTLDVINRRGSSLDSIKDYIAHSITKNKNDVLFVDSVSRTGGGSLLGDEDTNRMIDLLNNLCDTWFAIGHTPRNDQSHIYGSVHFEAGADLMISLASETNTINLGSDVGVVLKVTKANDAPKPPPETLILEFKNDYGLKSIRKAKDGEFSDLSNGKIPLKDQLIDYLKEQPDGKTNPTKASADLGLNRGDINNILKNNSAFVSLGKNGKVSEYGLKANVTE